MLLNVDDIDTERQENDWKLGITGRNPDFSVQIIYFQFSLIVKSERFALPFLCCLYFLYISDKLLLIDLNLLARSVLRHFLMVEFFEQRGLVLHEIQGFKAWVGSHDDLQLSGVPTICSSILYLVSAGVS